MVFPIFPSIFLRHDVATLFAIEMIYYTNGNSFEFIEFDECNNNWENLFSFPHIYRITAKIDDDMLSYYCNEDIFLLEVRQLEEDLFDITLTELPDHAAAK